MKKKFFLCALMGYPALSFSMTDVTSKYYVEAALGTSSMNSKAKIWNNFSGPGAALRTQIPTALGGPTYGWDVGYGPANTVEGSPGFAGSASIGYDCRLPKSLLVCGAFFGGGGTGAHCSVPYGGSSYTYNPLGTVETGIRSAVYFSDGGFFILGGRFGVSVSSALAFFRLGWAPHRIQSKIQRMGTITIASGYTSVLQKKSLSSWISTLLLGVGIDVNLTKNLILGFLVEGHIGGQKDYQFPTGTFTDENGQGYNTIRVRAKPFLTQGMITMKYAIPTCVLK
jgi:opacity protein-like surface antigen